MTQRIVLDTQEKLEALGRIVNFARYVAHAGSTDGHLAHEVRIPLYELETLRAVLKTLGVGPPPQKTHDILFNISTS